MLKKKEIEEILETKRFWLETSINGEAWSFAGQYKAEVEILEWILEIKEKDFALQNKSEEVKK